MGEEPQMISVPYFQLYAVEFCTYKMSIKYFAQNDLSITMHPSSQHPWFEVFALL